VGSGGWGGAELGGPRDDTPAVIRHRLEVFNQATAPVLALYNELGLLDVVDATQPPDDVTAQIIAALPPLVRATPH
jgi:adenylate kinase